VQGAGAGAGAGAGLNFFKTFARRNLQI